MLYVPYLIFVTDLVDEKEIMMLKSNQINLTFEGFTLINLASRQKHDFLVFTLSIRCCAHISKQRSVENFKVVEFHAFYFDNYENYEKLRKKVFASSEV